MYLCGREPLSATGRGFVALDRPAPGAGFQRAKKMAAGAVIANLDKQKRHQ